MAGKKPNSGTVRVDSCWLMLPTWSWRWIACGSRANSSNCLAAKAGTGEAKWNRHAHLAFDWFLGSNDLQLSLYDPATGGCRDGLHSDRLNQNEGAESTLAFLMALLEMRVAETLAPSVENPNVLKGPAMKGPTMAAPKDRDPRSVPAAV